MKKSIVLIVIGMIFIPSVFLYSQYKNDVLLNKSGNEKSDFMPFATSSPYPFVQSGNFIENPKNSPQISTGYYFVSSDDPAAKPWRPDLVIPDTNVDASNWLRILSGPKQKDQNYWLNHPAEGYRYFRNPLDPNSDSTQNAIAGPVPIGFKFVFNGLEYDSFYVSTNGGIMLSNNRYFYNSSNERQLKSNEYGATNCYDPMSADWFDRADRSGNGLNDMKLDNWGWQRAVHISNKSDSLPHTLNAPLICPFWGRGILSQFDAVNQVPRDRGKVYFYKDPNGEKLIIYFVDFQLASNLWHPLGIANPGPNAVNPTTSGYISVTASVTLNRGDSSVNITYERFRGFIDYTKYLWTANNIFKWNTSCGIFGYARHQNFDSKNKTPGYKGTLPWSEEYDQWTYCWSKYYDGNMYSTDYPRDVQAFKFKQWKNTLRVCDIGFRVRKQKDGEQDYTEPVLTSKSENFELLAGHSQLGSLQPVAIVENLSNDIQGLNGVNFQPQDLNFRVRCAIINQATKRPLYNKYVSIDSSSIAKKIGMAAYEKEILSKVSFDGKDYTSDTLNPEYYDSQNHLKSQWNGIPPYGFVQIYFPPFQPNELFLSHIGLMKCYIMVDPHDPRNGNGFNDMWPFDDSLNVRFWVMRHIPSDEPFIDDVTEYHVIPDDNGQLKPVPSAFKWVSIGAEVVSGDDVSKYPLPPRGNYYNENEDVYPDFKVSSPVIKLNRPESVPIQEWGGDEIRSFPIDLANKLGERLTLNVQRTTKKESWDRGWSDYMLVGCEHRVVQQYWYQELQQPDELRIEFAYPSENWQDGKNICNIPEERWQFHPRRGGAAPVTDMPAYSLFGGCGYITGFLESDKDSSLSKPNYNSKLINGLRYDYYDDGIDYEYKKIVIDIPDTFINAPNQGAKYFRFRIKEYARNNQKTINSIPDDDDAFYIDNVQISLSSSDDYDLSINKIEIENQYSMLPASQATELPIKMTLSNSSTKISGGFLVKTVIVKEEDFNNAFFRDDIWIWKGDPDDEDMKEYFRGKNQQARDSARWILLHTQYVYSCSTNLPYLKPSALVSFNSGFRNARLSPPGKYVVIGIIKVPGGDLNPLNDTTFSSYEIKFGPIMAYHPIKYQDSIRKADNDVPMMMNEYGKGLILRGYKMGGLSSYPPQYEVGDEGEGAAGQIAVCFELNKPDTLMGIGGFYGIKNTNPDYITMRIYDGEFGPKNLIAGSLLEQKRGWDDFEQTYKYDEMRYCLFKNPIFLQKGKYWFSIGQLGETGFELGAVTDNMGMRCTNVYYANPQTDIDNGKKAFYPMIDKNFRKLDTSGVLINKNVAAFENGLGSGTWQPFTEIIGNPSYGHLRHDGLTPVDNVTQTFSRGSWMPLIVPYFGDRTYVNERVDCFPVELLNFKGKAREGANDLTWCTATELNNYGFYIERKVEDGYWNTNSELIPGNGTSKSEHTYYYTDEKVKENITYYYRLRQVDLDGTQTDDEFSGIVTLVYTENGEIALLPNSPNPFTYETEIKFILPEETTVSLEIFDIFGNSINTILNDKMETGTHSIIWKGNNNSGTKVSSGTYIYRLRAGESSLSGKMIYIRE